MTDGVLDQPGCSATLALPEERRPDGARSFALRDRLLASGQVHDCRRSRAKFPDTLSVVIERTFPGGARSMVGGGETKAVSGRPRRRRVRGVGFDPAMVADAAVARRRGAQAHAGTASRRSTAWKRSPTCSPPRSSRRRIFIETGGCVSLARLESDGEIEVHVERRCRRSVFGTARGFLPPARAARFHRRRSAARSRTSAARSINSPSERRCPSRSSHLRLRRRRRARSLQAAAAHSCTPRRRQLSALHPCDPLFSKHPDILPNVSSKTNFIGAVEIGTSKVTVLVGEYHRPRARDHRLRRMLVARRDQGQRRRLTRPRANARTARSSRRSATRASGSTWCSSRRPAGTSKGFYNEAAVNVKAADNMIERDRHPHGVRSGQIEGAAGGPHGGAQHSPAVPRRRPPGARHPGTSRRAAARGRLLDGARPGAALADNIHVIRGFNLEVRELCSRASRRATW